MNNRVEFVQKCLRVYGEATRNDHINFTGRECDLSLSKISSFLDENKVLPTFEQWLEDEGIVEEYGEYFWK